MAGVVDELGGGSDKVGDDGEEPLVNNVLRRLGKDLALGLGYRCQAVVIPGQGEGLGCVEGPGALFGEGAAVPGEPCFFQDGWFPDSS